MVKALSPHLFKICAKFSLCVVLANLFWASSLASVAASIKQPALPLPLPGHTDLSSAQIQQTPTPCISLSCLTQQAQSQNALGHYREFARTMLSDLVQADLRQRHPEIDLQAIQVFAQLPQRSLPHAAASFTVAISNAKEINGAATDYALPWFDARPRLTLEFNGIPQTMIFDTGAGLDLPAELAQQFADKFIQSNARSRTGAALAYASPFVLIDSIKLGPHLLHNSLSSVQIASSQNGKTAGLFGTSEFLHFGRVLVDIQAGQIEFNSAKKLAHCLPLRLRFNSQNSLEGIVVPLAINGQIVSARLDTGANSGLLVHNKNLIDPEKLDGEVVMLMKDIAGNQFGLKQASVELQLGQQKSTQTALIAGFQHPAFDATLGIKFFQRRAFLLDFMHSELCVDRL